jgi:hypothetical protein
MNWKEIQTSPNFRHSHFPHCWTQSEPLEFKDPRSTSRKLDACENLLKIERKIGLSAIDDDMYPIISCYRDFSLKWHETYPLQVDNV